MKFVFLVLEVVFDGLFLDIEFEIWINVVWLIEMYFYFG